MQSTYYSAVNPSIKRRRCHRKNSAFKGTVRVISNNPPGEDDNA